jgi:hypothetical protein
MLDLTSDLDSGFLPVTVKINGVKTERNVDLYDAYNHLVAFTAQHVPPPGPADIPDDDESGADAAPDPDGAVNLEHARKAAVAYFHGADSDWSQYAAGRFWDAVVKAVTDLGKGGSDSDTPS